MCPAGGLTRRERDTAVLIAAGNSNREIARALGIGDQVGSIEVGKKADLTLVDLRRPHLYPANMPLFHLIYFANGNDVDTVIVNGVVALENRKAVLVDENAVLDAAQRETEKMLDRLGLHHLLDTPKDFWGH